MANAAAKPKDRRGTGARPHRNTPENKAMLLQNTEALAAAREAKLQEVIDDFGLDRALVGRYAEVLGMEERRALAAHLLMAGLSFGQVAKVFGIHQPAVWKWFASNTDEMQRAMALAMKADALKTLPKAWATFKELLDSTNAETKRKAALDVTRAAGTPIDLGALTAGLTVNIHAKNAQFNSMPVAALEQEIRKAAEEIGSPEVVKLVEAKVKSVRDIQGHARSVVERAPDPAGEGPVGGGAAEEARPAD